MLVAVVPPLSTAFDAQTGGIVYPESMDPLMLLLLLAVTLCVGIPAARWKVPAACLPAVRHGIQCNRACRRSGAWSRAVLGHFRGLHRDRLCRRHAADVDFAQRPSRNGPCRCHSDRHSHCRFAGLRQRGGARHRPAMGSDLDRLPVTNPTCLCFGGRDMKTLFVTSASKFLTPEQWALAPLAGSVFALEGVGQGLPENLFED